MIKLVEGAERQKTPNEIALNILLAGLTIIFVFATVTIPSYAAYAGGSISVVVLVALFVTLIPTTIGALLSAIGIAGMDRLVRFNVLAMSGRAVEAAGDVDTLLLDKTGTITLGNRQATEFKPVRGVTEQELADAAQLASLADETPEGRSIVVLAKEKYGIRGRDLAELRANFIPFTAQSRMSGVEIGGSWCARGPWKRSSALSLRHRHRLLPVGQSACNIRRSVPRPHARSMPSPTRSPSPAARRWP
jgi:K+-transporting ATPase ATPase B chain